MKTNLFIITLATCVTPVLFAAPRANVPEPTASRVVERGANHRVWQRETFEKAPDGRMVPRIHKYTELAGGMHYKDEMGNWLESKEEIEAYPKGAIARQGRYQVIFADNLNSEGSIDLQTSDGKRLRSNVLGLSYYDHSTGETVLIAQVQDATGELVSSNQVIYANAFDGLKADVRYFNKRSRFEQDIILREQPLAPEAYGLKSESTELVVMTEFLSPPKETVKNREAGSKFGKDQDVSWGAMRTGPGRAFDFGDAKPSPSQISVRKQYATVNGRKVLLEWVPIKAVASAIEKLPEQASLQSKQPKTASKGWQLPAARLAKMDSKPMKLASSSLSNQGFVLDYVLINSDQLNFTFQADNTYYISDWCYFEGITTFEGGTVIKFNDIAEIWQDSTDSISCKTGSYKPAVFTSVNDNSVGEPIGSGSPAYQDVYCFLNVNSTTVLHDMRFSYCDVGINLSSSAAVDLRNCQFFEVGSAVWGNDAALHNVLISCSSGSSYDGVIYMNGNNLACENVTSDRGLAFAYFNVSGANACELINCIITSTIVTNGEAIPTFTTNHTVHLPTLSAPLFQTVGAGSYYLTNGSPYRNAGTASLDSATLADLRGKTTYPPMVYANTTITAATTFSPQAQRDTDTPDLGYHYDSLDYAFGLVTANSNINFTAGTAVAWFSSYAGSTPGYGVGDEWGLGLMNNVTATFAGTVTAPCYAVQYSMVQEDGNAVWMQNWHSGIQPVEGYDPSQHPSVEADFTVFTAPTYGTQNFSDGGGVNLINLRLKNSEIYNGFGGYNLMTWFTNCLLFRVGYWHGTADSEYAWETNYRDVFKNCTFYGGYVEFAHWEDSPYWQVAIQNCAFDGTTLNLYPTGAGMGWLTSDYNATNTSVTYGGEPLPGSYNIEPASSSFAWQSSWFGDFYLPSGSALIDAGSAGANLIGLYHFTTQTDQTKETNSTADIGYHYVATDAYGKPMDTDDDGTPDYLEDANGNGSVNNGETDWQSSSDLGLRVLITRPRSNSQIP